jgi:hypothetical protein
MVVSQRDLLLSVRRTQCCQSKRDPLQSDKEGPIVVKKKRVPLLSDKENQLLSVREGPIIVRGTRQRGAHCCQSERDPLLSVKEGPIVVSQRRAHCCKSTMLITRLQKTLNL